MFKWFAYIVLGLVLIPSLLAAKLHTGRPADHFPLIPRIDSSITFAADTTTKKQQTDDKKKIKEIKKAKPVPIPEKVDDATGKAKKRQRRPPGMERPPEIPRHNGN